MVRASQVGGRMLRMGDLEALLLLLPRLAAMDVTSVAVVAGTLVTAAATYAVPVHRIW